MLTLMFMSQVLKTPRPSDEEMKYIFIIETILYFPLAYFLAALTLT